MAQRTSPIAIVGVSALFPGSETATGFWRDILAGRDLITDVPESHWLVNDYYDPNPKAEDKTYCKRGAFLTPVSFDPVEHGIPPSIMPATDTSQLLALMVAKQVLDDASAGQFASMDKERISVILGVTSGQELFVEMGARLQRPQWLAGMREAGIPEDEAQAACDRIASQYVPWQESSFPGLLGNVVAGRIANRFDLGGTNCVTDAACASSLSALSMAINELQLGHSDMVICGGVDTFNDISMFMCFSKTPALSPTGDCRPFSDQADGTIIGEGLTMVAVKRLEDAERDGDRIYAVIRGLGTSSDGRAMSVYAPLSAGQAKALRRAYDTAGYDAGTVELIEAHGTGTKAGDAAEFGGLKMVFGDESGRDDHQWCALGSVKSQIGHTKSTAGAAGLFKAVMALHHKVLPPTIKVDRPNPKLAIEESPFYLNTEARPWIRKDDHPRRASVSAFGFGGSNFHVALEEYTGPAPKAWLSRTFPTELVVLTAADPEALAAEARAIAGSELLPGTLGYLARTTQEGFDVDRPARLAVVASDEADLAKKLLSAAEAIEKAPQQPLQLPTGVYYAFGANAGRVAFLFPGQGSQYVNMGRDLAMGFAQARGVWDKVAGVQLGESTEALHQVVFPLPVFDEAARAGQLAKLTATQWAQPAIGAASQAQLALLGDLGVMPDLVAGHSFGEVTALHAAGVLAAADALKVGRKRGELMASAAGDDAGTMAAVALGAPDVQRHLDGWGLKVVIANDNSPRQTVISGAVEAVAEAERRLSAAGVTAKRLPVAAAFHSTFVSGARAPFETSLGPVGFGKAEIPVYSNAEAAPYPGDEAAQRALLASQIARPVRFTEMVRAMHDAGARTFVEVGPGSVLTALVQDVLAGTEFRAIALDRKGQHGVTAFWHGLAQLAVAGVALDFATLWAAYAPAVDPRSLPKPKFSLPICGTNFGKLYPPKGGEKALPAANPARPAVPASNGNGAKAPVALEAVVPAAKPPAPAAPAPVAAAPVAAAPKPIPAAAPAASPVPVRSIHTSAAPAAVRSPQGDPMTHRNGAPQPAPGAAQAYALYQQALTDSHMAYLKVMEASLAQAQLAYMRSMEATFLSYAGADPAAFAASAALTVPMAFPAPAMASAAVPMAAVPVAQMAAAPVAPMAAVPVAPMSAAPVAAMAAAPAAPMAAAPMAPVAPVAPPAVVPMAAAPVAPAAPAKAPTDLAPLLLAIVAEKTGYPVEMLTMDMALEADLGVDSIKRVEILSAVQERVPGLPDIDAGAMASLRTLGQIAEHIAPGLAAAAPKAAPAPAAPAPVAPAPVAAAPAAAAPQAAASHGHDLASLQQLMLAVVAEKTGYPVEMLTMEMALEADLGVDSIKRVEILSAVQERAPGLPEVDAGAMASLRTLGQIVEFLGQGLAAAAPAPVAPAPAAAVPAPVAAAPTGQSVADLTQLMLEVVAEKTGYPVEMLNLDMALEADLGVDSIKRVEILSAVQERAPGLPEVDAAGMASLRTLRQIVEFMAPGKPMEAAAGPRPNAPVADASAAGTPAPRKPAPQLLVPLTAEGHGFAQPGGPRQETRVLEARATGHSLLDRTASGPVWIVDDGQGVAPALALRLRGEGFEVTHEPTTAPLALIDLGGLAPVNTPDAGTAVCRAAFGRAHDTAARFEANGGTYVTVQDTGGDFGFGGNAGPRAWSAGLSGLAKTAALEWPLARVRAIDLETAGRNADDLADAILAELLVGGTEREVGLKADGRRVALQLVDAPAPEGLALLGSNDVVLASGGARGVTAATLIALAKATQAHVVLLGRTPLEDEPEACHGITDGAGLKRALLEAAKAEGKAMTPMQLSKAVSTVEANREVRETLKALRKAGSEALYLEADVRDKLSLEAALAPIRSAWGPITALVHGAGVLADRRLTDKTLEQFDTVYNTKVDGLKALLAATTGDPLKAIVMFSSVAGRHGNVGQADYAMANEVLNKVAQAEAAWRGDDCVVKSLNWGPWAGGMVTPELAAHFERQGVPLLPVDAGAAMLVAELRDGPQSAVEVMLTGAGLNPAPALNQPRAGGQVALEVSVLEATHGFLNGHRIQEVPVVPAVMVLEWFLAAARQARPDMAVQAVRDLRVLKGVQLDHFAGAGDRFTVRAAETREDTGVTLALELRGVDGVLHYAAAIELVPPGLPPVVPPPPSVLALEACPWDVTELYGDLLFHGPAFQVIRTLEGVSREGLVASLAGVQAMSWAGGPWQADVAMLDGGLQLARLWGIHMLGRPSLPTALGEYRAYQPGVAASVVRCEVRARVAAKHRTVTDIRFLDDAGELIAELRGVEMHLLPEKRPAQQMVELG